MPTLLTVAETAERLRTSRATVYRLLDERELRRIKLRSRTTRIAEDDVVALIERRRAEAVVR